MAITATYQAFDALKPFASVVYSYQAHGYFIESGVTMEHAINSATTFIPKASLAYDVGYANNQRNGFSHAAMGATLQYQATSSLLINIVLEQTIGGSIIKSESSKTDHLWGGINIGYVW